MTVRVRPLHGVTELGHEHVISCFDRQISVKSGLYHDLKTSFDQVLDEVSQEEVYRKVVAPMIPQFLQGFNSTVFTYGQTGSGKTFTMFGEHSSQVPPQRRLNSSLSLLEKSSSKIKPKNRFTEAQPLVVQKPGQERKDAPELGMAT